MTTIQEALKALNSKQNVKLKETKNINESLDHVKYTDTIDLYDDDSISEETFKNYANDPIVQKYSNKNIYDELLKSNKILEMTAEDFGDGHGDPKGYLFGKDGAIAYIILCSNAYEYYPDLSFSEFKDIVQGKDLFWNEIGFGNFSGAEHYILAPTNTADDIIGYCDKYDYPYFNNLELYGNN